MDIYNSIRHSIDRNVFDILTAICEKYNINFDRRSSGDTLLFSLCCQRMATSCDSAVRKNCW